MELLISVIIPAYNIENYIEHCLKSVCGQTYHNLEIIVIDDGSTDQTGILIDRMAVEEKRIIPIHKKNGGVSAARNAGLDIAKGDYIGFVDGDDIIEPNMYELLLKNALKYDADISHCGYQMVFPNRIDYYYNSQEIIIQDQYQGVYDLIKADKVEPGLCNKLYKRKIIGDRRLDETIKNNEDLLFNYILFSSSAKAVFYDIPLYHYIVRKNSASTSKLNKNKLEDPLIVIQKMMKQEQGEIYGLLEKRYLYLLEKVSALKISKSNRDLICYQKEKQIELKHKLRNKTLKASYSGRELFQLNLVSFSPVIYRLFYEIYSRFTGSKNKYKI